MRRQAWAACLVLVFGAGACALDRRGTEFSAEPLVGDGPVDAGVADVAPAAASRVDGALEGDLGVVSASEGAAPAPDDASSDDERGALASPGVDAGVSPALSIAQDGASSSADSGGSSPEAAAPASCDADGDGHMAAGPPCFGDDCCDTDPNVHPGQTGYFTAPSACGSYDYDCDGQATPQYAQANCVSVGVTCGGDGFDQDTACGVEAPFTVCTASGILTCTASVGSLTQACR